MEKFGTLYKTSIDAVLGSRIEGECEGHVEKSEDWGRTTENQGTGT